MKRIILSLALISATFVFAQKKEINAAFKAIESGDVATAQAQIAAADSQLNGKLELLEPELLENYYFAKGLSLLRSGKTTEGASYLVKINDLAKSKVYSGRDGNKNRVYFVGKSAADASGISGLKEESYTPKNTAKLAAILDPVIQAANKTAMDAYNAKNYGLAADKFRESYNLLKAFGQTSGQLLYNSGLSYISAKNNSKAIEVFKELTDSGYTGVETIYTAKEKATGTVQQFDKATWDALKKSTDYTDFKTETSKSIEEELQETYASLLVEEKRYDDALAVLDKAVKKFPKNNKIAELQSSTYYKAGKTEEFTAALKRNLALNPNDAVSWYNLGVLQSKDPATKKDAETAFKKAIELDPKMFSAHMNLTYLIMGDDEKTINDYKALRDSGKTDEANKVMDARRARFEKALPIAEDWYSKDPNNLDVVTLLKGMYQTTRNEAKRKEFKEKEDMLLKAQGK